MLTVCFLAGRCLALRYHALVLQIYVPTLGFGLLVFEGEREYGVAFLDGVFPPSVV